VIFLFHGLSFSSFGSSFENHKRESKMINIFQPCLGKDELAAIKKVFKSNWIGKGEFVTEFERSFAQHVNCSPENLTTTTSCSEAIFLASELFNYNSQDEVIVPSISFVAVGNSILAKNAKMILCDVDPYTLNVRAEDIESRITSKTKAVIVTHYGGFPCDMDSIMDLCRGHNIIVIEDSACATKSFYKGKACGTIGDMGMWSFGAMKVICTGDGGVIYLKSKELVEAAKELLYHGFPNKQKSGMDSSNAGNDNWWEYSVNRIGRRAFLNNIAGAMGVVQLNKLDGFLLRKKEIYERYCRELSEYNWLTLPPELREGYVSSYYFFWIQLEQRDELARFLREQGVYSTFRYWPLHKVKHFQQEEAYLPNSDFASARTLNIPLHQALSDDDVSRVIELIKKFGTRYI